MKLFDINEKIHEKSDQEIFYEEYNKMTVEEKVAMADRFIVAFDEYADKKALEYTQKLRTPELQPN